jgi:hypothetical protein
MVCIALPVGPPELYGEYLLHSPRSDRGMQ